MKQLLAIAFLLSAASLPAHAQKIYRCTGAGGGVTISDTPCSGGQGGAGSVKPASGSAAKPPRSQSSDEDKMLAETLAGFSPECRRAYEAFNKKMASKEGQKELQTPGNPITAAWLACDAEQAGRAAKSQPSPSEIARAQAEERKRQEQSKIVMQKSECATKQKVLDERRPRLNALSEADRIAFRTIEQEVAANCR